MLASVLNVWDDKNVKALLCRRLFTSSQVRQIDPIKSGELVTGFGPNFEKECGI